MGEEKEVLDQWKGLWAVNTETIWICPLCLNEASKRVKTVVLLPLGRDIVYWDGNIRRLT